MTVNEIRICSILSLARGRNYIRSRDQNPSSALTWISWTVIAVRIPSIHAEKKSKEDGEPEQLAVLIDARSALSWRCAK